MTTSFKDPVHAGLHSVPRPCSRLTPNQASNRDSWILTGKSGSVSCGVKQLKKEEKLEAKEKRKDMHLNAVFQRMAGRDKKSFLSDQGKQVEENNRMGKTRDFFKIIRDAKGTFHSKMGTMKVKNIMDLTEAEDIKRWQEDTEELYKKIFMTQITIMVLSPTQCQTSWNGKSSGPQEASL